MATRVQRSELRRHQGGSILRGGVLRGGYTTVFDGVVGPWFLPTFLAATGLERLDYVMLLPSVETCVQRVETRRGHGFTDASATKKMHAEFARSAIAERHVLVDPPGDAAEVAGIVETARERGQLAYTM